MNVLRVVCKFLLSLVHAFFPQGLKGRHGQPGDPVVGTDSSVVDPVVANGGNSGSHRGHPVDHPSGSDESEKQPPSLTPGNLLGWLLIGAATVKLFS